MFNDKMMNLKPYSMPIIPIVNVGISLVLQFMVLPLLI